MIRVSALDYPALDDVAVVELALADDAGSGTVAGSTITVRVEVLVRPWLSFAT